MSTDNEHCNSLINETSPYLLQHAHTPVNWYPWGEEALADGGRTILDTALFLLDPDTPFALVPAWAEEEAKGELPCRHCEFLHSLF